MLSGRTVRGALDEERLEYTNWHESSQRTDGSYQVYPSLTVSRGIVRRGSGTFRQLLQDKKVGELGRSIEFSL